jgi:imidazole glycerol-phosphate synthase subunit HisH
MTKAVVVDMGMGNIQSLISALTFLGAGHKVGNTSDLLDEATHLVLPGVGAFDAAMSRLTELDLIDHIRSKVLDDHKPILGICLGMQLLGTSSEEGELTGLDLVRGRFRRLDADLSSGHKVPHVGFSEVRGYQSTGLFDGMAELSYFYFTHSYALMETEVDSINVAYCQHTVPFIAAYQQGVISAAQFHPEKSQSSGLRMLHNFLATNG